MVGISAWCTITFNLACNVTILVGIALPCTCRGAWGTFIQKGTRNTTFTNKKQEWSHPKVYSSFNILCLVTIYISRGRGSTYVATECVPPRICAWTMLFHSGCNKVSTGWLSRRGHAMQCNAKQCNAMQWMQQISVVWWIEVCGLGQHFCGIYVK